MRPYGGETAYQEEVRLRGKQFLQVGVLTSLERDEILVKDGVRLSRIAAPLSRCASLAANQTERQCCYRNSDTAHAWY